MQSASEIAEHGTNADLAEYFTRIANPVFTSAILAASYKLFWESPVISRLTIFLLGLIFSLWLYFYLRKREGIFGALVAVLLVIANPLFVVYSQYVCTDVPFMVFASAALVLLLYAGSSREQVLSAIMLGVSLATKYVVAILFPVVLIYSFVKFELFSRFSRTRLFQVIRFNL
ncbi:ArnT family glycosyltransferase [Chloroflexota bacterium]